MYKQENESRSANWPAGGGSTGGYRDGVQTQYDPQILREVLGGSLWSWGNLHGTRAYQHDQHSPTREEEIPRQSSQGQVELHHQTHFSPAHQEAMPRQASHVQGPHQPSQYTSARHGEISRPSSQSHGVHHQDQFLPALLEEIARQSSQSHTLKQEYLTPRQENMRGQHTTPISISSGGSWRQNEFQPSRPLLKRGASPSIMYEVPSKRQQTYNASGMMHPSRAMPEIERQLFLGDNQQTYDNRYVNEQQPYQQVALPRTSHSPYEQAQSSRVYSDRPTQRQFGDPQQYISPQREPPCMPPSSYHSSQGNQFRGRSPPRAPFPQPSSQPTPRSPQRQSSTPQAPQHGMSYEQVLENLRAQLQQHQNAPYKMAEQGRFQRAMTDAPENYQQHRNEDESPGFSTLPAAENVAVQKPPPHLDSPLWQNAKVRRKDAPQSGPILVQGHYVEPAGKRRVPDDQIDRRGSDIPFTPPQQRAKTPSVSSQLPSMHSGRSKSVAPPTRGHDTQNYRQEKSTYQPPSLEDASDNDNQDSTPLNELLSRQQRQGNMSRNNFDKALYRATSVLPQESIFSHNRPKAKATKPPIPQFASSRTVLGSPEVISLISTPGTSVASPVQPTVCSIPMKERITPAKNINAKKSTIIPKSTNPPKKPTPKTPKKLKGKADEEEALDPVITRQKRAANLIITKEIKGADESFDLDLFGEVIGQTEEEKQKKEDEMRAESQRKRLVKEAELQAREEAEQLAERERMRVHAEKVEHDKLEKEKEDERNKARWEAERKRCQALEERELDELRKKAAAQIEAGRKKAEEEAAERERVKQEAQEKAEKIQAEADELAKRKAKQVVAKKQAASLSAAKVPMLGGVEKADGAADKDLDVVMEEECTLFLPEIQPEAAQTDDGSRTKSNGPSSAAEVFAKSGPKAGISAYRAEREEAELQREKSGRESRLHERWKRQEAAKAMQQAPPPSRPELVKERPKASKAPIRDRPAPKSKTTSVISPPSSDVGSASGSSASQPVQYLCGLLSTDSSFSSTKSAPAALPPKPHHEFKSQVKLISQLEREKLEREQHAKSTRENALKKAARTEQQKAERKKRDDEKARVKRRQQLIDEAKLNGTEVSEESLEAQVEVYMAKRESDRQRRAENQARKERILDFAPDNLALQSLIRPEIQSPPETQESTGEDEELTIEEQVRRANEAAMKESLKALAQERGRSFSRAAAKKTVADFQSDSESEEDPDDEPPPKTSTKGSSGDGDQDLRSHDSDTDDDEATALNGLNPGGHDAVVQDMIPSSERRNGSKRRSEMTSSVRNLIDNPNTSDNQLLMLYTIKQELTFNGKDGKERILNQFLSRKEANDFAAAKVQELRKRQTKSISEGIDDDDLYFATVTYDRGDKNQAYIYVSATPISSGELADFDSSKVEYRLDEKTYLVIQYISQRRVDETGEIHIDHNEPEVLSHFSQLEMANHEACTKMIALLKPSAPRLEYAEQLSQLSIQLREARDEADKNKALFEAEIEPDETQLQWVDYHNVRMAVKLFPMKGPRN